MSTKSADRSPQAPDPFPNLIDNGRGLYLDASLIPPAGASAPDLPPAALALFGNLEQGNGFAELTYLLPSLESSCSYLFEVRLFRDHNIDGVYPSVLFLGREIRLSDFWQVGEWQKFSLFFPSPATPLRPEDRRLKIRIPRGDYRLMMEDLSLRKFGVKAGAPEEGARRAGEADFSWRIPVTDRLVDLSLSIVPSGGDGPGGDPALSEIFNNADGQNSRTVAINRLRAGLYRWRIEARQYRTLLAASEWRTLNVSNREGGTLPGAPSQAPSQAAPKEGLFPEFFPIGIYDADTADFAELRSIGFNAIHLSPTSSNDLRAKLEAARKNGLKVLIPPGWILKDDSFRTSELVKDTVLAFYLADEPEGSSTSPKGIWLIREKLRNLGFPQPGAMALLRPWRAPDYASSTDIFMSDPYPVPFEPLTWIAECLDEIRAVTDGDPAKSTWSVIQAFGWRTVNPSQVEFQEGRDPTPDEIREMARLALLHGARGIFFYSYKGGESTIKDHPGIWQGVRSVVGELSGRR